MADPMLDDFARWFGAEIPGEEIWRPNLPESEHGWNSLNLKRAALVLRREWGMRTGSKDAVAETSRILLAKLEAERSGGFMDAPSETWGRTYPSWNAMPMLAALRQAHALGLAEEGRLAAGWLRSFLAGAVLAAGWGPGRQIRDHQIERAERDLGSAIVADGPVQPWYSPFVATCGPRGAQRTRDASVYGTWQMQSESACSAWVAAATGLDAEVRRHRWVDLWPLLDALDARYPMDGLRVGLTDDETATAAAAFGNDPEACKVLLSWIWPTAVTFRWIRTTEGVLMQRDRARGSSTADLDACAWRTDGTCVFLCGDPGWRHSNEPEPYVRSGSCRLEQRGGRWWAIASRDGRPDVEADLLGGDVIFDGEVGPGGSTCRVPGGAAVSVPTPQQPPQTEEPTMPTETPIEYHKLTKLVPGLVEICMGKLRPEESAYLGSMLREQADRIDPRKPPKPPKPEKKSGGWFRW